MRGRVLAEAARGAMIRADCAAPRSSQDAAAPERCIAATWNTGGTECNNSTARREARFGRCPHPRRLPRRRRRADTANRAESVDDHGACLSPRQHPCGPAQSRPLAAASIRRPRRSSDQRGDHIGRSARLERAELCTEPFAERRVVRI